MNKKNVIKVALLPLAALILTGCMARPATHLTEEEIRFKKMVPVALEKNDIMPTEAQLAGSGPRVVVFETDHSNIEMAVSARTGQAVTAEIEKLLTGTEVELVDRSLATKLGEELQLAEMRGNAEYQGEQIADYAILAKLSHTGITEEFQEKGCTFVGEVSASVRVYKIPSMRPVTTEILEGSSKAVTGHCTLSENRNISSNRTQQLTREAAVRAVSGMRAQLHKLFAPTGYVIEMREKKVSFLSTDKPEVYVKVTLGTRHNLKEGDVVEILSLTRVTNPLTKRETIETSVLTSGTVQKVHLLSESAWIEIPANFAGTMRFGQPVRIKLAR